MIHLLALKRLRERPLVVALSVSGVAAGVALAVAVSALLSSLTHSIDGLGALWPGAELELAGRSPLGFPESVAEVVGDAPGVRGAVPQLRQPALVDGQDVMVVGRSDIAEPMAGRALVDREVDGGVVEVATPLGPVGVTVQAAPDALAGINGGRVLLLPLGLAQELTGRGGVVDSLLVDVDDSRAGDLDGVGAELQGLVGPGVLVVDVDATKTYAVNQIEQVQQPMNLMSAIALVAGAAMVFNTVQASARQRSRELAILRAVGATKRQVSAGLVLEATIIGLVGAVVGLTGGLVLARFVVGALPSVVETAAGTEVAFHVGSSVIALALASGLGVALVSAIVPVRRIVRSRPNQVLQRRPPTSEATSGAGSIRTAAVGGVLSVAGLGMTLSPELAIAQNGLGLLLAGLLVLGYGLARPIALAAGVLAARTGPLGSLSQASAPGPARRVWAVAAAVFVAVALAITVGSSARNQVDTSAGHLELTRDTDVWISTAGSDDLPIDYHFPTDTARALSEVAGVAGVTTESIHYAVRDDRRYVLIGIDGPANYPVFALAGPDIMARVAAGEGAVITSQYARSFDLEIGDTVDIAGAEHGLELPVLAVTDTVSVSNFGTVIIGRTHYVDAFGDPGATGFQVVTESGVDNTALAAELGRVADRASKGAVPVVADTGIQYFHDAEAVYHDIANVFLVVLAAIVALAGLATLNATAASVVERRRQLGVLRSLGATRSQIRRIVVTEAISAGVVGAVWGVAVGALGHWVGVRITNNTSPFPTEYAFSPSTTLQALTAAALALGLGALIPATHIARADIRDAMAYE